MMIFSGKPYLMKHYSPSFFLLTACFFIFSVVFSAATVDVSPVVGQKNNVKSVHNSWSIICETPGGAISEQCAMIQNVVSESSPDITLSIVVLRTADNKQELLRVLAPLGILLPNGLGLKIDDKDIGRADFIRCFRDGCYAEVVLEKKLLASFKKGSSATFIVFRSPEKGIGIPIDLKGFGKALLDLP